LGLASCASVSPGRPRRALEHPLWTLPNVIISPHYSGAQPGYFRVLGELFIDNLQRYARGEPLSNVVDKQAGY
jgi:D-2-hydroxyacid dehydrogenase (NADP+)